MWFSMFIPGALEGYQDMGLSITSQGNQNRRILAQIPNRFLESVYPILHLPMKLQLPHAPSLYMDLKTWARPRCCLKASQDSFPR